MSDDEFLAATDRWWPSAGRAQVFSARTMVVAHASFLIGWLDVDRVPPSPTQTASILVTGARWPGTTRSSAPPCAKRLHLTQRGPHLAVLGLRVLGSGGGPTKVL